MIKVVIDTNVLISALLKEGSPPALIVSLMRKKQFTLCLSQEILDEYKEVLTRKRFEDTKHFPLKTFRNTYVVTPKEFVEQIVKSILASSRK